MKEDMITIKRSYSRKLSLSNYGGNQYETVDLYCERSIEVPKSEAQETSLELFLMCKKEVEKEAEQIVKEITNEVEEVAEKESKKKIKTKSGLELDKEELEEIMDLVNDITMSKSLAELKKVAKAIKKRTDSLTKTQYQYLKRYYLQRKKQLS